MKTLAFLFCVIGVVLSSPQHGRTQERKEFNAPPMTGAEFVALAGTPTAIRADWHDVTLRQALEDLTHQIGWKVLAAEDTLWDRKPKRLTLKIDGEPF